MWVIRTKLEPPAPTDRLIARHRLRKRLPAVLRSRLTLVHAPAGFGKTSLLAEWARSLRSQNVRTAWLSVDEDDADPLQFLAYLTAALETAGVEVGHLGPAAARGFPDVPVMSIVMALTRALERVSGRVVVIVDDYQRIAAPRRAGSVGQALMALMGAVTMRMTFIIAGRERPVLQASSPVAAHYQEIGADELRFTAEEARRLLDPRVVALSEDDLARLNLKTDGWAIALATARQWLTAGWQSEAVLTALSDPKRDLRGYLTEQILRSLTPGERAFLRNTCVVDRYSAGLATALCPGQPVDDLIATLERKDLIVNHWDAGERWLRYHRLLSETALAELRSEAPQIEHELHRVAAEWFFAAGLHAEAVRHAIASGDELLLAALFERAGGWWLVVTGNIGLARNAMARIPPAGLRNFPRSYLAWVLMLAKQGHVARARSEFARLAIDRDDPLHDDAAIIEGCLLRYEDRPVTLEACTALARRGESLGHEQHVLRATYGNVLCAMYFEAGDLTSAIATAHTAVAEYRRLSSLFGEVFVYVHLGCALLEGGRLRDAETVLQQAWRLACDTTGPNTETEAVAACMLGVAIYERGAYEDAERLLLPALDSMEQGESWYELLARGYWAATGLARRRGGIDAALDVIARARRVAALRDIARLEVCADVLELRERALAVDTDSSRIVQLEASLRAQLALTQAPRVRYRMLLALAHLDLARAQPAKALTVLHDVLQTAHTDGHERARIEALALRGLALHASGDRWQAAREFEASVALAMFEGCRQVFRDLGQAVLTLADADGQVDAAGAVPRVSDQFLRSIVDDLRVDATAEPVLLSERERVVLRLLAQGLTNKAIARALQVSENTVKFHLKNVFAKLGVDSRAAAVRHLERSG